jgi:AcrR family transcriptional regulator
MKAGNVKGGGNRSYESPLREEQTAATRERILATVAELIVNENPALVSIPMIAEQARVSTRTVYRHFPTKEDLYSALFSWATDLREGSPFGADDVQSVDDIVQIVTNMFERIGRHPALHRATNALPEARGLRVARAPRRRQLIQDGMRDITGDMAADRANKIHAVVHLLSSSDALLFMEEYWGLTSEEAAAASAWAIKALAEKAKRVKGAP